MFHVDRHVVKMILETAQLLSSAVHMLCSNEDENIKTIILPRLYKLSHKNHPSAIWARDNINNWTWLLYLGLALCKEYTFRYEKTHKTEELLIFLKENIHIISPIFSHEEFYPPTPAMDEQYLIKNENNEIIPMLSYRNYYINGKKHLHSWKKRNF